MKPLRTERLVLRNWQERDRDLFFRINSEDRIMEFFPFRRDRGESDTFMDKLSAENEANGYGWAAAEIAKLSSVSAAEQKAMAHPALLAHYQTFFGSVALWAVGLGVLFFALTPLMKKWMHGMR